MVKERLFDYAAVRLSSPGIGAPRYPASSDRDRSRPKRWRGRLSGLPDCVLVERDRIEMRFAGAKEALVSPFSWSSRR